MKQIGNGARTGPWLLHMEWLINERGICVHSCQKVCKIMK